MKPTGQTQLSQTVGDTAVTLQPQPAKVVVTSERSEQEASGLGSEVAGKTRYNVTIKIKDKAAFDPAHVEILISLKNLGERPIDYRDGVQVEYLINDHPVQFDLEHPGIDISAVPSKATGFMKLSGPEVSP